MRAERTKVSHRKELTQKSCKNSSTKDLQTKYVVLKIVKFPLSSKHATEFPKLKHEKCQERSDLFQTTKRSPSHDRNAGCTECTDHQKTTCRRDISSCCVFRCHKKRGTNTNHVYNKNVSSPRRDHARVMQVPSKHRTSTIPFLESNAPKNKRLHTYNPSRQIHCRNHHQPIA